MNYLKAMTRLLRFDLTAVKDLSMKQLQYYSIVNLVTLGIIYGYSAAFFSKAVLIENGYDAAAFNAVKIIAAGIPVAFLLHAGAALFVWVFLKAMGGKADFLLSYFTIGVAAISLWAVSPFIAALQTGSRGLLIIGCAACFSAYAFAVNVVVIKDSFGLSRSRMAMATSITTVYIGCFLYLWV